MEQITWCDKVTLPGRAASALFFPVIYSGCASGLIYQNAGTKGPAKRRHDTIIKHSAAMVTHPTFKAAILTSFPRTELQCVIKYSPESDDASRNESGEKQAALCLVHTNDCSQAPVSFKRASIFRTVLWRCNTNMISTGWPHSTSAKQTHSSVATERHSGSDCGLCLTPSYIDYLRSN